MTASPNAEYGRVIDGLGMTPEQQASYWQERYFALLDEHAALINDLQAIRNILDGRLSLNDSLAAP